MPATCTRSRTRYRRSSRSPPAIGLLAFVLSWLLPDKTLRDTATASTGVGEAFATPRQIQSEAEAARALSVLIGREKRRKLVANIAARAGVDLSPAACWLIAHLQDDPAMDIPAMSRAFDIPEAATARGLQELAAHGYVTLDDSDAVTAVTDTGQAGRREADRRAHGLAGAPRRGLVARPAPGSRHPADPDGARAAARRASAGRRPHARLRHARARLPRLGVRAAPSSLDVVMRRRHPRCDAGRARRTLEQEERHVQR